MSSWITSNTLVYMHLYIKYMYIAVYLRYHVSLLVNINIFYMTPQRATWKNSYYMLNVLPSLNKVLLLLLYQCLSIWINCKYVLHWLVNYLQIGKSYRHSIKEWVSFFLGSWDMNRSAEQTNRVNREAVLVRFVCSALRFISHEPRKKDTHSLYLQCLQQRPL